MNRVEYIKEYLSFLKKENLKATDIHIGAGGSLLMYGLRKETGDIDADAPEHIFQRLKKKYPDRIRVIPEATGGELLEYNEFIDLHHRRGNNATEMIDGICCETLEVTLEFKKRMNRPKDQEDIRNIEAYLKKKRLSKESIPVYMHW